MPIYRYRCTGCGRVEENLRPLKEGAPKPYYCRTLITYPKFDPQPVGHWGEIDDASPMNPEFETYTKPCQGIMKRIYDDFRFHISGR